MKPSSLMSSIAVALLQWTMPHGAAAQSSDEAAIRQVQVQQAEAWNRHDAPAYAALFSEDGDVVNVVGWWWKGRPRQGIQTQVLQKQRGKWLIAAFQNTNGIPERAFPRAGAPSKPAGTTQ
jgi:hypothetical protein